MANTVIQLKHSTETGNVPASLANGEISINNRDGKFFYSTPAGVVVTHYPYPGPAGLNQEVQFNDSGVLGSDSGLTYNKTTDVLTVVGGAIIGGVNVTPQIQLAFTQANTPSYVANSAATYANGAFAAANAATTTNTTQNNSITAAFTRANNSLDANNGGTVTGTITATSFITTGSYGNIQGANVIYSNVFVANSGGYVQFSDGSKQYTANAADTSAGTYANAAFATANTVTSASSYANSGFAVANSASAYANAAFAKANTGTTGANSFGIIYTSNNTTYANAATANARVNFVGENGSVVYANAITNTITFAGTPGLQGLTVDYGFVNDPIFYSLDYGTL